MQSDNNDNAKIAERQAAIATATQSATAVQSAALASITIGGTLHFAGPGAPTVSAPVGSTYHRTDGGAGTSLYVKESGGSTSSGWVGK